MNTYKLAHQSLLKLKKYEGLLYNKEHEVSEMQQHTDICKDTNDNNKSKLSNKNTTNTANNTYTYLGTYWKYDEFGHAAKECRNNLPDTKLNNQQDQTMINTYRNMYNTSPVTPIEYPTKMLPTKPPILTQKITSYFKLSQEHGNN